MEYRSTYSELNITAADFSSYFRFTESEAVLVGDLLDVLESGISCVDPAACVVHTGSVSVNKGILVTGGLRFNVGMKIAAQMRFAESLMIFVCTAGSGVTELYQHYMNEGDFLKAYYADLLGSVAVEKMMNGVQEQLKADAEKAGLHISNRYSPGYCGWQLFEQRQLFGLLPENPCGVRLTPSFLMLPQKSISGIIGIGEKLIYSEHNCSLCELEKCFYRKT